jgi:hypothetical protein
MGDDYDECIFTSDDPPLDVTITHNRDRLKFGGKVEQDYRFLTYVFPDSSGDIEAHMYLDDADNVTIAQPVYGNPVPASIMTYLQRRFRNIMQVGGTDGSVALWESKEHENGR